MPTRVLFLTDCNPKVYSGGRYHAFMMAEAAALSGHEVTIWAPAKPLFWRDFVDFPAHERLKLHLDKFETRPDGEFDIVVIIPDGSSDDRMYREGLRIAKKDGARVIFLNFESGNWFNSMSPAPRPIEKWDNWRRTTRFSDMVLSSGAESSRHARGFYIDVQPHIIFADCHPSINSIEADKVWQEGIEPENQVIAVSRFGAASKHKGLDQLLDLISDRHDGLTVALLAGTGAMPPEATLRGMQAQFARKGLKLKLLHNIGDREKFEHIARSRAVLFPTFFEGFGYPPVEALYMGRPCVTYDLPILHEVSGNQLRYAPIGDREQFRTMLDEVLEAPLSVEDASAFRSSIASVARLQNYAGRVDQLFDEVLRLKARPAATAFTEDGFSYAVSDALTLPETLEVETSSLHRLFRGLEVRAFDSVFRARVAFLRSLAESPEHRDRFAMALADNPSLATRLLNLWISRDSTRPAVEAVFQEHFSQSISGAAAHSAPTGPQETVQFVRNLAKGGTALNDFLLQIRSNSWLRQSLLNTALLDLEDGEVASIVDYLRQIGTIEKTTSIGESNIAANNDVSKAESSDVDPVEALLSAPQGIQRFMEFCETNSEIGSTTINEILGKRALRDQVIESLVRTPPGRSAMARGVDAARLDATEFSAFMKSLMRTKSRRIELAELIVEKNGDNAALIAALDPELASANDVAASIDFALSSPHGALTIASREEQLDLVLQALFANLPTATSALEPYLSEGEGLGLGLRAVLSSQDPDGGARLSEAFAEHSSPAESQDLGALGRWLHDDGPGALAIQQHLSRRPDAAKLLISAAGEKALADMLEEISKSEDGEEHLVRLAAQYPTAWKRALEVSAASPSGAKAMAAAAAQSYDASIAVAHELLEADSGKLALKRILGTLFEDSQTVDDLLARPGVRTAVLGSFAESGVASDLFNGMDLRRLGLAFSQVLSAQPELVEKIVEDPNVRRGLVRTVLEEAESDSQLRSWLAAGLNQEQIAEHVRSSPLSRELRAVVFGIIDRDPEHAAEYATALLKGPIMESNPELVGRVVSKLPLDGEFGRYIQRAILQHEEFLSDLLRSIPVEQLASALGSVTIGALVRAVLRGPDDSYGPRHSIIASIEENEAFTTELAVGSLARSPRAVFSAVLKGAELSQERVAEAIANVVREEEGVLSRRLRSGLGSGGALKKASESAVDGNIPIATWRAAMSSRKVDVAAEVTSLLKDLKWVLPRQFNSHGFQEDAMEKCSKPADVLPLLRRRLTGESGAIELNGARLHFPEAHDLNALIDEVLRRKAYAFETSNSAPFIIDGGANFGIATYAYLAMYPDAQVVAFEPGRRSLVALNENVQENNWSNVTVHPFALSSEDGETTFYEPKNMPMGGSITRRLADRDFGCATYDVKTVKLSDYIDRPVDLLKLDIEGAESAVIDELGEKVALARRIYVEVHSTADTSAVVRCGQLAERFEALGFQCRSAPNHAVASPFGQINREHSYVLWARQ